MCPALGSATSGRPAAPRRKASPAPRRWAEVGEDGPGVDVLHRGRGPRSRWSLVRGRAALGRGEGSQRRRFVAFVERGWAVGGWPAVCEAAWWEAVSREGRFFLLLRETTGVRSLRRSEGSSRTAAAPLRHSTLTKRGDRLPTSCIGNSSVASCIGNSSGVVGRH